MVTERGSVVQVECSGDGTWLLQLCLLPFFFFFGGWVCCGYLRKMLVTNYKNLHITSPSLASLDSFPILRFRRILIRQIHRTLGRGVNNGLHRRTLP